MPETSVHVLDKTVNYRTSIVLVSYLLILVFEVKNLLKLFLKMISNQLSKKIEYTVCLQIYGGECLCTIEVGVWIHTTQPRGRNVCIIVSLAK